ncbi:MAG: GNAT family N-acetyltransferase [Myxococcota bacterium]
MEVLREQHRKALQSLLLSDLDANLYLLQLLQSHPIHQTRLVEWTGAFESDVLIAATCALGRTKDRTPARLIMVHGREDGASFLGRFCLMRGGTQMLLGERKGTDAYWRRMNAPKARLFYNQRVYSCIKPSDGPMLPIKKATEAHYSMLHQYAAEMMLEDLKFDPRSDEHHHERTINSRIQLGKTWVHTVDGQVRFMIDVGMESPKGAQVGGTYVPTDFRGNGLATNGMRAICGELLKRVERVTLHVNEANSAAIRCYERAGFVRKTPYRLIDLR